MKTVRLGTVFYPLPLFYRIVVSLTSKKNTKNNILLSGVKLFNSISPTTVYIQYYLTEAVFQKRADISLRVKCY